MRRFGLVAVALLALAGCDRGGTPPASGPLYSRGFGPEQSAAIKTLVFVLHGDAPYTKPYYQYGVAEQASKLRGVRAFGLLRPGYEDRQGNISPGVRGNTTGDNYTPDRVAAIAGQIAGLARRYPRARRIVMGHSGGAAITADLAALYPRLIDGIVLVSCPCVLAPWRAHMRSQRWFSGFGKPVDSYDSRALVPRLDTALQVAMLVGSNDDTTPPALSQAYAKAIAARGIRPNLSILPGKDHEIFQEPAVIVALRREIAALGAAR